MKICCWYSVETPLLETMNLINKMTKDMFLENTKDGVSVICTEHMQLLEGESMQVRCYTCMSAIWKKKKILNLQEEN